MNAENPKTQFKKKESLGKVKGRYACRMTGCNKAFVGQTNLWRHLKFECNSEKLFKCGHCNFKAHYPYCVVKHSEAIHPRRKLRVLNVKGNELVEWNYKNEREKNNAEKTFRCGYCDFSACRPDKVALHCRDVHYDVDSKIIRQTDGNLIDWHLENDPLEMPEA